MANHPTPPKEPAAETKPVREVELIKVVVSRSGKQVSAEWAIHPQMKVDLLPREWEEVSELMTKITSLVGVRFAEILANAEPDPPGHA